MDVFVPGYIYPFLKIQCCRNPDPIIGEYFLKKGRIRNRISKILHSDQDPNYFNSDTKIHAKTFRQLSDIRR